MKTYPETRTFSWEEKDRLPLNVAYDIVMMSLRQKGSAQRKAAYVAVRQALELIEHEHGPEFISTAKFKQLLIAAAHEHEWYALDMKQVRASAPPMPRTYELPEGMRCCRKCRETKPKDEFLTDPSPAKARRYGWSEDTTQKVLGHLCTPCRKANQQKEARKLARRAVKDVFAEPTEEELRAKLQANPALAERMRERHRLANKHVSQYQKLSNQIEKHTARVRAAFANAKTEIKDPDGSYYEYQFATDYLRQFYESKRVLLAAAKRRLDDKLGEAAPLPDTWGMLLTKEEQLELADLHEQAVISIPSRRAPSLWSTEINKQEVSDD